MFGHKKKAGPVIDETAEDEAALPGEEAAEADLPTDEIASDDEAGLDKADQPDQWTAFDLSRDWRDDGPFDIDEVDLSADQVKRLDLGALIVTPEPGMGLKLVVDQAGKQVMHLVVEKGPQSALQLTLFAAPATGDYRARIRQDIIDHTEKAKVIEMAEGPFGTELRRVLTVTDEQGNEGFAPLRDWLIGGPRWVLNARLIGQAALDSLNQGPAAALEEFVRNVVVRRGDMAMVPGTVVPLRATEQK